MATSMIYTVSPRKMQPFINLLLYRNLIRGLNVRLYSNNVPDDKSDFFGIPEGFELQHYRHSVPLPQHHGKTRGRGLRGGRGKDTASSSPLPKQTSNSKDISTRSRSDHGINDPDFVEDYHHKPARRDRRMNMKRSQPTMNNYKTNFGVVSVDRRNTDDFDRSSSIRGNKFTRTNGALPSDEIFQVVSMPSASRSISAGISNSDANNTTSSITTVSSTVSSVSMNRKRSSKLKSNGDKETGFAHIRHNDVPVEFDIAQTFPNENLLSTQKAGLDQRSPKTQQSQDYKRLPMSDISDGLSAHISTPLADHNFNDIDSQYFQTEYSYNKTTPTTHAPSVNTFEHEVGGDDKKATSLSSSRSSANVPQTPNSEKDGKSNIFDEFYFPGLSSSENQSSSNVPQTRNSERDVKNNIFDEFYFPELSSSENKTVLPNENDPSFSTTTAERDFNTIDDQYFGQEATSAPDSSMFSDFVSTYDINKDVPLSVHDSNFDSIVKSAKTRESFSNKKIDNEELVTNRAELLQRERAERKQRGQSTSAFDLAMKIRSDIAKNPNEEPVTVKENVESLQGTDKSGISPPSDFEGVTSATKGRVDSKGFRILSDQVADISKMPSMDILEILKKSIVFDHEDFLVIDKPYGLPSIGQMQDTFSLSSLLPALGRMLPRKYKASDLHVVQGLDRDVTGNVLLAKNPEVAYMMKGMFKANEVIQRYWAITKGVPSPRRGMVDIPVGVGKVGSAYKMVLRPHYGNHEKPVDKKSSRAPCQRAVTEYNVLSSHQQAALVECRLHTTGIKHQIRVHLSNGLNTPILGDHKYSHFSKLAPQKLDRSTLELLNVRQAKVRHISLHLHCHSLVLPEYKSRTYVITSHLPSFFAKNMKSLKLYLPK